MSYEDVSPFDTEKESLTEWRGKITVPQKDQLQEIEKRTGVPMAAMVRMALDVFLPKVRNNNFTEDGIRSAYLNRRYL